jgi:uncharacterized protein
MTADRHGLGSRDRLQSLLRSRKPIIGMVHLGPLPGSPRWSGSLEAVYQSARRDAEILITEGLRGVLVENYGDAPFYPDQVPPETTAAMAVLIDRLRRDMKPDVVWGVNVLRNDAAAGLAVAAATGASFIRVNVHTGVTATDQGLLEGRAHQTLRRRTVLAREVAILADVRVKHGHPIHLRTLSEEAADTVERGLADGILITGSRTGEPPDPAELETVMRAVGSGIPVLAASGVTSRNVAQFLPCCHGIIVGTSLKRGGRTVAPVDRSRVRRFVAAAETSPGGVRLPSRSAWIR